MNDPATFELGSPAHWLALLGCAVATVLTVALGRRFRKRPGALRALRGAVALGCLVSWVLTNGYLLLPQNFRWDIALPLQFCNVANLIGAHAVWTRRRWSQALLYHWALALCIWAFLTPALNDGPGTLSFWLFWIYHVFIPVSLALVFAADRLRPNWADFRCSLLLTALYAGALAVLDSFTGWNYGFVGPGMPSQPSLVDLLGPYPLRLLWMALIATAVFAILTAPWVFFPGCCRGTKGMAPGDEPPPA